MNLGGQIIGQIGGHYKPTLNCTDNDVTYCELPAQMLNFDRNNQFFYRK